MQIHVSSKQQLYETATVGCIAPLTGHRDRHVLTSYDNREPAIVFSKDSGRAFQTALWPSGQVPAMLPYGALAVSDLQAPLVHSPREERSLLLMWVLVDANTYKYI